MFLWLKNLFNSSLEENSQVIRWSQKELTTRKLYLENKLPEQFTLDDWIMVEDYLFQRYLPKNAIINAKRWHTRRKKSIEKIKQHMPEMAATAVANIAARDAPRPEQIKYSLTRDDFDLDILPNLARFRFIPDPQNLDWSGKPLADSFFLLSSPNYPDIRAAKDVVMGKCDDFAVMHIARALRRNYETLRTSEIAGYKSIHVMSGGKYACEECKKLNRTELRVADLLAAYRNATIAFPHETLPYDDDDDTAHWCDDVCFSTIGHNSNSKHSDDPRFAAWLNEHFKKGTP